jgi:hypothetical protein
MLSYLPTDSQILCLQRVFNHAVPSTYKEAKSLIKSLASTVLLSTEDQRFVSQFVGIDFPFDGHPQNHGVEIIRSEQDRIAPYISKAKKSAIYPHLHASFKERMDNAKSNRFFKREFILATIETIVRHARKLGWETKHTSDHKNRASSRYIKIPNSGICRISDHSLYNPKKYWNGEVIISYTDCYTTSLEEWLKMIIQEAMPHQSTF